MEQILAGEHREFVGGIWEELGKLQLDFLISHGLLPKHKLLDIGCGALRCGIPLVRYLDHGNYHGIDINTSLVEAGRHELRLAGLADSSAKLVVNESFDYAIAQSLFTHLSLPKIGKCLSEATKVMKPESILFATFFQAPNAMHTAPIVHDPGGVVSKYASDPFHQSLSEIEELAKRSHLSVELIGDWGHPRDQRMLRIKLRPVDGVSN